eukprot:TRINITY_DN56487_c0_g1_i1.p1 TRINITY_DN56487_c0_g1~~TRINITY_DN56487_c0_g1_i1.p1  ORF type:complete len:117 (+),score=7.55 TRINITY_DN56487_c0_g1_i1:57-407(+)
MSACRAHCFILWFAPTMSIICAMPISCRENNIAGACDPHIAAVGGVSMLQHTEPATSFVKDSVVTEEKLGLSEQEPIESGFGNENKPGHVEQEWIESGFDKRPKRPPKGRGGRRRC